jgi:small conductance mechanosensitive channel
MTNAPSPATLAQASTAAQAPDFTNSTVMRELFHHFTTHETSTEMRLLLIVVLALLLHLTVKATRGASEWLIKKSHADKNPLVFVTQTPKFVTLIQLMASSVIFVMYFFAMGLVLEEFGVKLKNYLASASILALAVSFGSQGLVQDVVISLTLIFSDTMDVGDMVEIVGSATVIGRVEEIGLRFITLRNFFNQAVFIPNRTIANVSRFPHGGVLAYADVQIPMEVDQTIAIQAVQNIAKGIWGQFGAIILEEPVVGALETADGGDWQFVRILFKIWPGQGGLIETTFRQQIISKMKALDPAYADWQVPVTYRAMTGTKSVKASSQPNPSTPTSAPAPTAT